MKTLVTGTSGFVGKHILERLNKNKDHDVIPYDLLLGKNVLDEESLEMNMRGCDNVIHLASLISAEESWTKPLNYLETNGLGTAKVIISAIKSNVKRVVYFSSAAVYGDPLTPYGASKLWGESVCETYKNDIEVIVLRPFNIYGVGLNSSYSNVINKFISAVNENKEVVIYGDGTQTRDFIYIKDVVEVVEKLLKINEIPDFPIDLGTGIETKISDLIGVVGEILNKKYVVKYESERKELKKSVAQTNDLNKVGIKTNSFVPLKVGLKEIINEIKKN